MTGSGLILAAPASRSGKTTVTLAILRALSRRGLDVRGAKSGPDYIDPAFHAVACGKPSMNLDAWAMTPARIRTLAAGSGLLVVEGAMGLFDGAPPDGAGSTADLARILGLPVILVVDAARQSQSIAALVRGFATHDPGIRIAGLVLNNVGSPRHADMLRHAIRELGIPVLGHLPRAPDLILPERHLGLVQAQEHAQLDAYLDRAADLIDAHIDLDTLQSLAAPFDASRGRRTRTGIARIAVARDAAFAFCYSHLLHEWTYAGTEVIPFSPLADDPVPDADFVFLPGGYPELHAARIASAATFLETLRAAARTTPVYGECGGYMVLGETLIDADGARHAMAGLLGLTTSFQTRGLHLGYRDLTSRWSHMSGTYSGHEFHYATTLAAEGTPLWNVRDAAGTELPQAGLQDGNVAGSFAHMIDVRGQSHSSR